MPEDTDTLDLAIEDVSEASWEDLVKIMMADELDITGINACACNSGSGGTYTQQCGTSLCSCGGSCAC